MNSQFVTELLNLFPEPIGKMRLIRFRSKYEGKTVYIPTDSKRSRRIRAAKNMTDNGMLASDVVETLVERFNICDKTARRDLKDIGKID